MAVKADTIYTGVISDAYQIEAKTTHALGLYLHLETEDGPIGHTLWLEGQAKPYTEDKLLECFGITRAEINDDEFMDAIHSRLVNETVKLKTKSETYNGNTSVKVDWMNSGKPRKLTPTELKQRRGQRSGGPVSSPAYTARADAPPPPTFSDLGVTTDDDLPF